MKKWLIALGVALLAGYGMFLLLRDPWLQFTIAGKTQSTWVCLLRSSDPAMRREAAEALDSSFFKFGLPWGTLDNLSYALGDQDPVTRAHCASILGKIGQQAESAVPALVRATEDEDSTVRQNAVAALGRIGERDLATPALLQRLEDKEKAVRLAAAASLGEVRASTRAHVPVLIAFLGDPNVEFASWAATVMGELGHETTEVAFIPSLTKAARDARKEVREAAIQALGRSGRKAEGSVQVVIDALKDEDYMVRWSATSALGELPGVAERSAPALARALRDPKPFVRDGAAWGLERLAYNSGDVSGAVDALIEALKDRSCRMRANRALGQIGPAARRALPALEAIRDADGLLKDELPRTIAILRGEREP